MKILDITSRLNSDYDIILKATFYIDPSLISEDDIVHVKGDFYKILDWEYGTSYPDNSIKAEKFVTLTLERVIIWKQKIEKL
jgi:hypothetical protein